MNFPRILSYLAFVAASCFLHVGVRYSTDFSVAQQLGILSFYWGCVALFAALCASDRRD